MRTKQLANIEEWKDKLSKVQQKFSRKVEDKKSFPDIFGDIDKNLIYYKSLREKLNELLIKKKYNNKTTDVTYLPQLKPNNTYQQSDKYNNLADNSSSQKKVAQKRQVGKITNFGNMNRKKKKLSDAQDYHLANHKKKDSTYVQGRIQEHAQYNNNESSHPFYRYHHVNYRYYFHDPKNKKMMTPRKNRTADRPDTEMTNRKSPLKTNDPQTNKYSTPKPDSGYRKIRLSQNQKTLKTIQQNLHKLQLHEKGYPQPCDQGRTIKKSFSFGKIDYQNQNNIQSKQPLFSCNYNTEVKDKDKYGKGKKFPKELQQQHLEQQFSNNMFLGLSSEADSLDELCGGKQLTYSNQFGQQGKLCLQSHITAKFCEIKDNDQDFCEIQGDNKLGQKSKSPYYYYQLNQYSPTEI